MYTEWLESLGLVRGWIYAVAFVGVGVIWLIRHD